MFIKEIIQESVRTNQIEGDLNDLLISIRANDVSQIETGKVVNQLKAMGHGVSSSSLISFLEGNPLVQTVTVDSITFKNTDMYAASGDDESKAKNREKVKSLAKKAATKGIKQ
jgi:hypothetical protein